VKVKLRILGLLAAPLPIFALTAPAACASSASPGRVALANDVVPALAHATPTGAVAAGRRLGLELSLTPRDKSALDAFVRAVSDPHSSSYKHYLTVPQFAARYGATDAQIAQVAGYLESEGLSVGQATANHLTLPVSGTAAQVEKAFAVSIGTYRSGARSFYANTAAPSLPASIASLVQNVAGLSTASVRTAAYAESPASAPHSGTTLTPTLAREGYNLSSDISTGYNGSGETIGLVEFSAYSASAVSAYNSKYALGATAASVVKVDGGTTDTSGSVEDELDIEVDYALAPKSTIKVYEAPNSDAGEVALYAALASNDVPVVSSSWGEPEDQENNLSSDDTDFEEMASQGQSVYAASGDSGADDNGSSLSVDYPASDPYVSGVGGTNLTVTSGKWASETGWSGSGGGQSDQWSTPSFQTPVNSTGHREVPDVSAAGGNNSPWYIDADGSWTTVWGTSAAAPNWAAFTADYDTAAAKLGKAKFGFADAEIYTVAQSSVYKGVFHDVTSGNNGGYSARTGYDEVTGWGSYNGGAFISDEL
jgi:kumamolisin